MQLALSTQSHVAFRHAYVTSETSGCRQGCLGPTVRCPMSLSAILVLALVTQQALGADSSPL